MVTAEGTAREFPVPSLPVTIGRGEEAKVRIPLASISRKHCELMDDDDELVVKDLGSSNGTYVNAERVKRRELIPGDLLAVGPVVFVIRIDGHPKDINAAESHATGIAGSGGGTGGEGAQSAIAGVPTWSGSKSGSGQAPVTPAPAKPAQAPAPAAAPKPAAKPPAKKTDEEIDSILGDLSESDFDIDFSDLDDDKPKK